MSLGGKQRVFTKNVALLIIEAYKLGYELTFGDCYRDDRCDYGHKNSLHRSRLAVDLNLFKDGKYLDGIEANEGHSELHNVWDSMGGAERIDNDLNHYSVEHQGMR